MGRLGMTAQLMAEQREMVLRLREAGWSLQAAGEQAGCTAHAVWQLLRPPRAWLTERRQAPRSLGWVPGPGRLVLAEREEISLGLHGGETLAVIAGRLGRAVSTVSREVARNGGRAGYRAWQAHERARQQARRPKAARLDHVALAAQVSAWLRKLYSPQQISGRLRVEFPDDLLMRVSHETIYQSLYVQGRGELRRELARWLRSGRAARRPAGTVARGGTIKGKVMISDRPAEAEDRAVPGHWEGDLIIGKNHGSAVGTLVERTTRYVMLLHLPPGDHGAAAVEAAMRQAITALPAALARSVTWDQGSEMAGHAAFTVATGIPVYFCNPHSPWERGSNENTNGLLRQYMPKGTDLSAHTAADLAAFAASLNDRPRKTLGFMKPSEKLAELVAHTP
jgi:IS30 family transposase